MSLPFRARPLLMTVGWVAQALDRGLRVTSRPRRFGRIEYVVRDDEARVHFVQGEENYLRGVVDEPTLGQTVLLGQLERLGVIEIDRRLSNSPLPSAGRAVA